MDTGRPRPRTVLAGFAVALAILAVLVTVVGVDEVVAAAAAADPAVLAAVLAVVALWLVAWSRAMHVVLRVFGVPAGAVRAFLLFANLQFVDNVTPLSALVGSPFAAVLVARATGVEYETGLAATVTTDFLNFVPGPVLAVGGLGYLALTVALGDAVETVAASLLAVLVGLGVVGLAGWRYRRRVEALAVDAVPAVAAAVGRVLPGVPEPDPADVADRVGRLIDHLEAFAADRRAFATALGFSVAGWLLLASSLWLSLFALGHAVPAVVVTFAVPLVTVTELVPLPGGVGSAEALLVLLVVSLAGVPAPTATAGVLLYRGATYWLPVAVGGGVTVLAFR